MKKLKANKITIYSSIDELKNSRNDIPFDKEKHTKYIKKMEDFREKVNQY